MSRSKAEWLVESIETGWCSEVRTYRERLNHLNEDLMDAHWRLKLGTHD